MIGLIRFQDKGIVAKSGFKYLRLEPGMTYLSERNQIGYNDRFYSFDGNKLYLDFSESDIIRETLTAIILKNCIPLNLQACSGECKANTGQRTLVFKTDMTLAPIVFRRVDGPVEHRTDYFAYNDCDFIKVTNKVTRNDKSLSIESSNNANKDEVIAKLSENTDLYNFLMNYDGREPSNVKAPVVNQFQANIEHLQRFSRKYSTLLLMACNVDPYTYRSLDIIDIETLDVIRTSDPEDILQHYPVVEFKTNRVNLLGNGLSESYFDGRQPDVYVYMIVTNTIYHRIFSGYKTVLVLNTRETPEIPVERDFVLLKFNKYSLQNFKSKSDIEILRDRK